MKKTLLTVLNIVTCFSQFEAQTNLVNNPSFETFTACPNGPALEPVGWTSFGLTPDYYNACGSNGFKTPSNCGYQLPLTGNGYMGFITYYIGSPLNEIIGGQLIQPLSIGQTYYVTVNFALSELYCNFGYIPSNKVGVKFSTVPVLASATSLAMVNNFAHVFSTNVISDTLNWTKVSGSFIADSNYKYVMIGNFFDASHTTIFPNPPANLSYFYVDDVCVSTSSVQCSFITNIETKQITETLSIFPTPANEYVEITISGVASELKLTTIIFFDTMGKECRRFNSAEHDLSKLPVKDLLPGIYFVSCKLSNGFELRKAVTIQK